MTEQFDDITRPLPHAVGPEKSILSSMLKDPAEYIAAAMDAGFQASQLYLPAHQTLCEVMIRRHEAGESLELVGFVQHLLDKGLLDRCGGPSAVYELYTYAPSDAYFHAHLRDVQGKAMLREMIQAGNQIIANAYESPDDPASALDEAERQILAIGDRKAASAPTGVKSAISEVIADMQRQMDGSAQVLGIQTGYPDLDRKTSGLKPGEMFVIAARPSVGKSALMMNIVEHVVIDQELPAAVFSCEMPTKQLMKRSIGGLARFDWSSLNEGTKPNKGDLQRIQAASYRLSEAPLYIDDTPAITISALRAKARRLHRRHGIRLIAVDYLQLLRSSSRQADGSREREVAEISAGLKALAKELGIPVIVLAQLNRDSEKRTGKGKGKPRMSDLRESGAIEQDADMIGLLSREAYSADTQEEREAAGGAATLDLAKNRNGATGPVYLTFIPEIVRFEQGTPPPPQQEPNRRRQPDF